MRVIIITVSIILSVVQPAVAQRDSVLSCVYKWKEPATIINKKPASTILFEGKVHDFEWMQISANTILTAKKKTKRQVPENEEHLLLIKSGSITASFNNADFTIGAGSIALLMPGENYTLNNPGPVSYYLMKYRSKLPADITRGKNAGGSFVKNWDSIRFNPHDRGGIRNYFERPTAMGKRLEMHVTTLNAGIKSHEPHTHRAEEMVLMIEGNTEMQIGDKFYKGRSGDIYYLGSNVLHAIRNEGEKPCMYFAFQFE